MKATEQTEKTTKPKTKPKKVKGGMRHGALDGFVKLSKPGVLHAVAPNIMSTNSVGKPVNEVQKSSQVAQKPRKGTQISAVPETAS